MGGGQQTHFVSELGVDGVALLEGFEERPSGLSHVSFQNRTLRRAATSAEHAATKQSAPRNEGDPAS